MSKGEVVVLGVNGHVGEAVARAFVAAGWLVTGMARSDRQIPGVRFVRGNSDSVEDMRRAIGDAGVVVNALNMPYDQWFGGRMQAQMGRVAEAMGRTGKTLLFPGNIYNYAADADVLTPDLPQHPPTPRGAVRVRVEQLFREAAERGDMQVRFAGNRGYSIAAVHDATGEMAALTQLFVDPADPDWGHQGLTGVTRPHRGHRLGLLTKAAMLEWMAVAEPQLEHIETNNASVNSYMISVNEALGFELSEPSFQFYALPSAQVG